jgi:hypothetical protein
MDEEPTDEESLRSFEEGSIAASLDLDRAVGEDERHTYTERLRVGLLAALFLWLAFGVIDWLVATYIVHGSLLTYWGIRGGGLAILTVALLRLHTPPSPSLRQLYLLDTLVVLSIAGCISLMCLQYSGIASPYAHGISLILVGEGVLIQKPWRRAITASSMVALSFPVVMLIAATVDDRIAAQLNDPRTVAIFIQNVLFVFATATFTLIGSHITWALRRKVFETRTIGRYRLKKCLGRGGMGEVWLAYHTALKRDVAIKILNPPPGREKSAVARFEREVVALTELRHPNTVRVFDFGVTGDGLRYYVMELLVGITLTELVDSVGPLPVERAVPLVRQVASALAEVHIKGMVHRDMKPDNLMIMTLSDGQEFVKVIDFGIARKEGGPHEEKLTMDGWIGGTPAFISPEAARGEPVGPAGDIYGVGGVLYYALTGRRPFGTGSAAATMYAHVFNMPKPPSRHAKIDIGDDIDRLVMRCLSKVPEERPRDGAELAMALNALQLPEGASVTDPYIVANPKPPRRESDFGEDATLSISDPGHFED